MAAAPATASAVLAVLTLATGKIVAQATDLMNLALVSSDSACFLLSRDHNAGSDTFACFVSASTSTAPAPVLTVARGLRMLGLEVFRYVISTSEIQTMIGHDADSLFSTYAVAPTDTEWIDAVSTITTTHTQ